MPLIHQIFIAPTAAAPMQSLKTAMVTTHGLAGDRYALRKDLSSGQRHELRDVTLISLDDIQESNSTLEVPFTPAEIRRNIVIAGKISLLDFVGRELTIGTVRLRGIEEAAPCRRPERLAKKPGFRKAFEHRAGIRAKVLQTGQISVGDEVTLTTPALP
ncbi:MAG TPA: MOSC domain-containing protein [Micropepsaceae bacterium]|nr:MOSC domain-containing protein [Micropepsaceae bacterium]